jgi:hypothetical protein
MRDACVRVVSPRERPSLRPASCQRTACLSCARPSLARGHDPRTDLSAGLPSIRGVLEDRRHDPGADVENLVLEAGEQVGIGEVVAKQAVHGLRADLG